MHRILFLNALFSFMYWHDTEEYNKTVASAYKEKLRPNIIGFGLGPPHPEFLVTKVTQKSSWMIRRTCTVYLYFYFPNFKFVLTTLQSLNVILKLPIVLNCNLFITTSGILVRAYFTTILCYEIVRFAKIRRFKRWQHTRSLPECPAFCPPKLCYCPN